MENGELVLFDLMYLCSIWVGPLIKLVKVERDYVFAWDAGGSFSEGLGNFPLTVTTSTCTMIFIDIIITLTAPINGKKLGHGTGRGHCQYFLM